MTHIVPSKEQEDIIEAIGEGNNVIIDSVAGSGKTTLIISTALRYPKKKFILFTYNARLKEETRVRAKGCGATNLEVHSYHSYGRAYYLSSCVTDTDLQRIIRDNMPLQSSVKRHVAVLDESQDMTSLYFKFLHKCLTDIFPSNTGQMMVLGDNKQCIYDFPQKGADYRFLTLADKLFSSTLPWKRLFLKTSYRITKSMEYFINEACLGYPRMLSHKTLDHPVVYITGDTFKAIPNYIFNEIRDILKTYTPSDIFILAPSLRSNSDTNPINKLENLLVKCGIPCYVPISEEEDLKEEVLEGKIVFSTFHQTKGLERKIVFVASFNSSYFTFYGKDLDPNILSNTLYVAVTRAKERLYLWGEGGKTIPFNFLKEDLLEGTPHVRKVVLDLKKGDGGVIPENDTIMRRVTQLTRFLPNSLILHLVELCKMVKIKEPYTSIEIPDMITTASGGVEMVYELNGIAIPTIYEHRLTKQISIQEDLKQYFIKDEQNLSGWAERVLNIPTKPCDYLEIANVYSAWQSKYIHKLAQIDKYDWLTKKTVESLYKVLADTIGTQDESSDFEYTLEKLNYPFGKKNLQINGRADLVDQKALWELKCVEALKEEHVIQLALYAWLWQKTEYPTKGHRHFYLHNIRTGELQELTGIQNLPYIIDMVLENHLMSANKKEDDVFIKECKDTRLSYNSSNISTIRCLLIND